MNRSNIRESFAGLHKKNRFLKLEEVEINRSYAFTFNPSDQPKVNTCSGVTDWWKDQHGFLKNLKGSTYRLYMEISPSGRFHFHGEMKLTNIIKFYTNDVHSLQLFSSCEMDTLSNNPTGHLTWRIYCMKQQRVIQEYLHDQFQGPLKEYPEGLYVMDSTTKT